MMTLALAITGARAINATGYDLIRDLRDDRGIEEHAPLNAGAVALAGWLVTVGLIGRAVGAINFLTAPVNEMQTVRHLTGETEPSESLANYLAEMTEGAVTPYMFARPAEMPEAAEPVAAKGRAADPNPPTDQPLALFRVSEDMILDRSSDGLFVRTPAWVVRIDPRDMAALHAGLGRMLGQKAA